jgi:transcriptional regulator with XRE-family HTH domain
LSINETKINRFYKDFAKKKLQFASLKDIKLNHHLHRWNKAMQSTMQQNTAIKRQRRIVKTEGPNPIDISVGYRIRQHRTIRGISQETLAQTLGISFQQVQKYESGMNRVSASKLFEISNFFGISPDEFFSDCEQKTPSVRELCFTRDELDMIGIIRKLSSEDIQHLLTIARRLRERG